MMTTSVHHSASRRPVWEYIAPVTSIHQMIKADAKTRIFGDDRPSAANGDRDHDLPDRELKALSRKESHRRFAGVKQSRDHTHDILSEIVPRALARVGGVRREFRTRLDGLRRTESHRRRW